MKPNRGVQAAGGHITLIVGRLIRPENGAIAGAAGFSVSSSDGGGRSRTFPALAGRLEEGVVWE